MTGIKGVVILTRFDFISSRYGADTLKKFQNKIELPDENFLRQPIAISKDYPEYVLKAIDDALLKDLFNGDIQEFLTLGYWNAGSLLPRYFQIYIDNKNPEGFLRQMVRLRPILIGLGDMQLTDFSKNSFGIHISYGQPFMKSVKLSEIGYLIEGCRLCGARNIKHEELKASDISVDYQLSWD